MRHFNGIVESSIEPRPADLWIHDGTLKYFRNGQWVPLGGAGTSEDTSIIDSSLLGSTVDSKTAEELNKSLSLVINNTPDGALILNKVGVMDNSIIFKSLTCESGKIHMVEYNTKTKTLSEMGTIVEEGQDLTGLEDIYSYGVMWDTTVADPHPTRIGNPTLHKLLPIQSNYRGCVAKGGKINYYLDPDDWSKKIDGSPSVLDGTEGTVKVHTPKFYGKSGSNGNYRWVRISTTKIDNTWVEVPEMLIDAYRTTVLNTVPSDAGYLSTLPVNSAISVVNTNTYCRGGSNNSAYDQYLTTDKYRTQLGKPRTVLSRNTMRTYARNAGANILSYNAYKWVLYWAFVIEYATFNSQEAYNAELTSEGYRQGGLGKGVTNINSTNWNNYNGYYPLTPCGTGNELGNNTGIASFTIPETIVSDTITVPATTLQISRYRGFLNPFGDLWLNLDGIIIQNDPNSEGQYKNIYVCDIPEHFADTITENYRFAGRQTNTEGYTRELYLGDTGEISPILVGGANATTYKCDYSYSGNKTDSSLRTLLVGGNAIYGGDAGLGYFLSSDEVGATDASYGFLTSCYPEQ